MAETVVGFFDDREAAQNAVQDLVQEGFDRSRVSIVASDSAGHAQTSTMDEQGNLAAAGVGSGATSGALVGGVAGLLIGLGFTVLPIAGLLLAGPIAGLVAGAATGAVAGGVVGGLIGLGIPKEHAEIYARGNPEGRRARDRPGDGRGRVGPDPAGARPRRRGEYRRASGGRTANRVSPVTTRARPRTARTRSRASAPRYAVPDSTLAASSMPTPSPTAMGAPVGDTIEVVEERLDVGKREVDRGGMRIRSFVTEKAVSADVTLREEHVDVRRTPVDRLATTGSFTPGTLEMRETAEVPVIAKEAPRRRGDQPRQDGERAHGDGARHDPPNRCGDRERGRGARRVVARATMDRRGANPGERLAKVRAFERPVLPTPRSEILQENRPSSPTKREETGAASPARGSRSCSWRPRRRASPLP